ncbi:MAG: PIN domain-containing protein [bacterium]
MLSRVKILPIGLDKAINGGNLLAYLLDEGKPIGIEDILIASCAISHNMTVITANTKDFIRLPGVKLENWLV